MAGAAVDWLAASGAVGVPEGDLRIPRVFREGKILTCNSSALIVDGQSWSSGYLLYLPLTDACEYSANGAVIEKGAFMVLEPGCEFCISTKSEHDWCSVKAADPVETQVSEVLLDQGVWELGRFAARYRRQFGELPSETLRKNKRK